MFFIQEASNKSHPNQSSSVGLEGGVGSSPVQINWPWIGSNPCKNKGI
jgi:hypothetical protein